MYLERMRSVMSRSVIVSISEEEWIERLKKLEALRDLALKYINEATEKQAERFNQGRKEVKFGLESCRMQLRE